MHPVQIRLDTWFVPYRIIIDEWEDFITGDDTVTLPTKLAGVSGYTELQQYFDVAPDFVGTLFSAPWNAYNRIWNRRYRDQDLEPEVDEFQGDVLNCAWEKDYYTTSRPWAAKGGDVTIPVRADASAGDILGIKVVNPSSGQVTENRIDTDAAHADISTIGGPDASLNVNVDDLRLASALQRYGEARARYGSRFTEYLRYLGITPSDARLQDPELLGSGRGMVNFSEVLQTAPNATSGTSASDGVGDLYGHGIAGVRTPKWRRFFEEHGVLMTLMSVRPKSVYTDTTQREWMKRTHEEFYQKELVNVGQQPVWQGEITSDYTDRYATWSYADRYGEYKKHDSTVKGEFLDVLNTWHLARRTNSAPTLNAAFVKCDPSNRIFQSATNDTLLTMVNNSLVARRMIPKSTKPRII